MLSVMLGLVHSLAPNLQPTNQPSSIYIAPSVPEDISSNIVDSTASPSSIPDVRNENKGGIIGNGATADNSQATESDLNYILVIIITITALSFVVFIYRR